MLPNFDLLEERCRTLQDRLDKIEKYVIDNYGSSRLKDTGMGWERVGGHDPELVALCSQPITSSKEV